MGCASNNNNNTEIIFKKKENSNKFQSILKEINSIKSKINNSIFPLECYLIGAHSISSLIKILQKINNKKNIDEDLKTYENENAEIYDNMDICMEILESNDNRNEFVLAGDEFEKLFDIKEKEMSKIDINNSKMEIGFSNSPHKIIFKPKSNLTFEFNEFVPNTTVVEVENRQTVINIAEMNNKNSYLLSRLVDLLINISYFQEFFKNNRQNIKQNENRYPISNVFMDIIDTKDSKKLLELNKLLEDKGLLNQTKFLIQTLIRNFFNEFENSTTYNLILNLFCINDISYYACNRCNNTFLLNNRKINTFEFNLEEVEKFCGHNIINLYDCFCYEAFQIQIRQIFCNLCKSQILNENKYYRIQNFPKILVIVLDRNNKYDANDRISFDIEYKINFDYITYINGMNINYYLEGILSYKKDESSNKFYNIALCKNNNTNKWICHDKYYKREIDDMNNFFHTPYILFYTIH